MSAATLGVRTPTRASGAHPTGWWAMVLVIATEATLFASFIGSYFYLLSGQNEWPPDGIENPKLLWPLIATVLLIGSSLPMYWADREIRRGNQSALQLWLAVAFVMAAGFIAIQTYEYRHEKFDFSTDSYSSLFFTITGLHGAHVLSAMGMNAYLQLRAWLGHFNARRNLAVTNVALYWHFVDAVWLIILLALYLSPRWLP